MTKVKKKIYAQHSDMRSAIRQAVLSAPGFGGLEKFHLAEKMLSQYGSRVSIGQINHVIEQERRRTDG